MEVETAPVYVGVRGGGGGGGCVKDVMYAVSPF